MTQGPPTVRTTTEAAVITEFGSPELLHLAQVPLPELGDEQVQVQVAAIGVNPVDVSTRAGKNIPDSDARFPMVLGWDVAGTVTAVGASVSGLEVGDRVAGMIFQPIDQRGTYAEYVNFDASLFATVPPGLSLHEAATIPLTALTAAGLLDAATAGGARNLLVTGPLGAVGRHVVALAAQAGLEVIGAAASERSDELLALGARSAVGRSEFTDTVRARYPDGVDAAIDLVGGRVARAAFDSVRDGGRYATAVPPYIDATGVFEDARDIRVHVHVVAPDTPRLTELLNLAAQGTLNTTVQQELPLREAAEAHRLLAAGGLKGRILLTT